MHINSAFFGLVCLLLISQTTPAQIVQFTNQPAQINDTANQTIECDLDAERTIRQHNQVVDSSKQQLRREQVRSVSILETVKGNATRAKITYVQSTTKVKVQDNAVAEAKQPIEGKTYLVARAGEQLIITDEIGQPISEEESKILLPQLNSFGKPNPLAQFLHGKQIKVGDSIDVPDEVAAELLGLTGNAGKTDQLALRLTAIKADHGVNCAVFETLLRSHSDESSISLLMKGELIIDPSTCQTRSIQMHGPVAISERRGPAQGRFTVSTNGSLKVAVKNEHQPATTAARQTIRR